MLRSLRPNKLNNLNILNNLTYSAINFPFPTSLPFWVILNR